MLHIILFILKLVGWILLAVLGLLVLLFCAVLFTPLRYQVESGCRGEISTWEACVKFQIFFRMVSGMVRYQKGELSWSVRAAWKKFGNQTEPEEVAEKAAKQIETTAEKIEQEAKRMEAAEEGVEPEAKRTEAAKEGVEPEAKRTEAAEGGVEPEAKQTEAVREEERSEAKQAETTEPEEKPEELPQKETEQKEKPSQTEQKQKKRKQGRKKREEKEPAESKKKGETDGGKGIFGKIAAFFEKIKYTFTQICDKIKALLRKKEVLTAFLTDEVHQRAFGKGVRELKKLLFRMRPKKIFGELRFGFADPSYTGRALAGLCMLSAIWEDPIVFHPDFEQKILDGNLTVRGAIRMLPTMVLAWNMLWNRDVRKTIRDIRHFRFE